MVKHVILWQLKDELSAAQKEEVKAKAKAALEGLVGKVDGLQSARLITKGLASSNCDMMLETAFPDEDALKAYQIHPDHQAAANTYIRPYAKVRLCWDYED